MPAKIVKAKRSSKVPRQRKTPRWLSPEEVVALRKQRARGIPLKRLAQRYKISVSTASRIASRERRRRTA